MKFRGVGFVLLVLCVLFLSFASAIPQTINLNGKLTNSSSGAALTGTYNMVFKIYNVPSGGSSLWASSTMSVTTDSLGVYNAILSGVNVPFSEQYYLGVTVGSDSEMSPRLNLTSSPYSFRANVSDSLNVSASYGVGSLNVTGNVSAKCYLYADGTSSCTAPVAASQTPWTSDIDGNSHVLNNASSIQTNANAVDLSTSVDVSGWGSSYGKAVVGPIGNINWYGDGFAFSNYNSGSDVFGMIFNADTAWFGSPASYSTWMTLSSTGTYDSYATGDIGTGTLQANNEIKLNTAGLGEPFILKQSITDAPNQFVFASDPASAYAGVNVWKTGSSGTGYSQISLFDTDADTNPSDPMSQLAIGNDGTYNNYALIGTIAYNGGNARDLHLYSNSNTNQLVLHSDGTSSFGSEVSVNGNLSVTGNVSASAYYGDGSHLTGISTYNATYATWAYNQTYSGSTYNTTYAKWAYNQTSAVVQRNIFNQNLNTTSNVQFGNITSQGNLTIANGTYYQNSIQPTNDWKTYASWNTNAGVTMDLEEYHWSGGRYINLAFPTANAGSTYVGIGTGGGGFGGGALNRFDLQATNIFLTGSVWPSSLHMPRLGDATSTANQYNSGSVDYQTSAWTGSSNQGYELYTYAGSVNGYNNYQTFNINPFQNVGGNSIFETFSHYTGSAVVFDGAEINGTGTLPRSALDINGVTTTNGLNVTGNANVGGGVNVTGNENVGGNVNVTGNITVGGGSISWNGTMLIIKVS